MQCPVCNQDVGLESDYFFHLVEVHLELMILWGSISHISFPAYEPGTDNLLNYDALINMSTLRYIFSEDSNFEERPISCDVEDVTEIVVNNAKNTPCYNTDVCPVCLEAMSEFEILRKVNVCSHTFCDACISKWCSCNYTCPMCVQDMRSGKTMQDVTDPQTTSSAANCGADLG